ncbi:hypothetical protein LDC_0859 [sediment metagenome]|uniref:Uncharacterized protein n=1 Tax=sediment metagenome TaxID=749907 RepID=D9PH59_9ZZZZ
MIINDPTNEILNLESDPIRSFPRTTRAKPFYMVYSSIGQTPVKIHWDFETAITESSRLAKINPGRQFFVLQAVTITEAQITPVKTERLID